METDARCWRKFDRGGRGVCFCTSLATLIVALQASDVEDAFNFFHSSLKIHVEQWLGKLAETFKMSKRLELSVKDSAKIIGLVFSSTFV